MKVITTPYNFKSLGRCIYCGTTRSLSDEHVIPASLGGDAIFEKASCPTCAEITRTIERDCSLIYGPLRIAHDFGFTNKPSHVTVELQFVDGRKEVRKIPIEQCPATPVLSPILPIPGILVGREQSEEVRYEWMQVAMAPPPDQEARLARFKSEGAKVVMVQSGFGLNPFMRMFAKIGHGVAVARYGLDLFEPILPDYILGKNSCLSHVVGCASSPAPMELPVSAADSNHVHAYQTGIIAAGNIHYVLVRVQLFRPAHFPVYEVVAGLASQELVKRDVDNPDYPVMDIPLFG